MSRLYLSEPEIRVNIEKLTGEVITLELKSSDTIKDLKDTIHAKEGIPNDQQHLEFDGKELEDMRQLTYYNIQNESTVRLISRDTVIYLETRARNIVAVERSDTIRRVKEKVKQADNLSPTQRLAVYHGGRLLHDDVTLAELDLQMESTLRVVYL